MIHETVYLKNEFENINSEARLVSYVRDVSEEIEPGRVRPSVLVIPGGAYSGVSGREAEPIALAFMNMGYNAFVLYYTVGADAKFPSHILEASAAMAYIRRNSEHYNAQSDKIVACGFSAGGHLAAHLGTLWYEKFIEETLGIEHGENRPCAMILGYPVITAGEHAHRGSFRNLLGENPDPELLHKLSLENSVGENTVPAFIWHTFADDGVPVENSLLFGDALRKANIPFEMHIYPDGPHGLSLGTRETTSPVAERENEHVVTWIDLCKRWLVRFIGE